MWSNLLPRLACAALLLAPAADALAVGSPPAAALPAQTEPTDAEVLAAFDALEPRRRREVADYLRLDLSYAERFQFTLVRYALALSDRDRGYWPEVRGPRWFDPEAHAPKDPIPRRLLEPDSERVQQVERALTRFIPERRLSPGYAYDWGTGDVVQLPRVEDPRRVVENALAGFHPDLDLAEALVLRALDDGSQRATLQAFGHCHTDRNGRVFPTVTLYDAWASGAEIEMPDVDVLGLLHTLVPEREWDRRWVAPVPESEHDALYGRIEELFVPAKQFRSLREALARAYLIGEPVMRDGFGPANVDVFHAFWDVHGSEVPRAASELPGVGEEWTSFLSDWLRKLGKDPALVERMRVRRSTLIADEAFVRSRLIAVMTDLEAL